MKVEAKHQPILRAIFNAGGGTLPEIAELAGCSIQAVAACAKRYDGRSFRAGDYRLRILYIPPTNEGSFAKSCPGIRNPRTGICERIPAEIEVEIKKVG